MHAERLTTAGGLIRSTGLDSDTTGMPAHAIDQLPEWDKPSSSFRVLAFFC